MLPMYKTYKTVFTGIHRKSTRLTDVCYVFPLNVIREQRAPNRTYERKYVAMLCAVGEISGMAFGLY